jgi:carbon storage regulator
MLVLSRKPGERILIGNDIVVTVVRFQGGAVRLGIEAPRDFAVVREELAEDAINAPVAVPSPAAERAADGAV